MAMLSRVRSSCGQHQLYFRYDARGLLCEVIDSCRRSLVLERDAQTRVTALHLPRPEGGGSYVHRRYRYDEHGDLVAVVDAEGKHWSFAYLTHLLTHETDRNGLSFHFAYDGLGEDAWCVRTWGDGGIYDHVLGYDKQKRVTYVSNSRGFTTQYHMNMIGLVEKVVDPLGGELCFEYDRDTLALLAEIDREGRETRFTRDDQGNIAL
ncbi:MAG: RHS repeat protein, partial [Myxococcales bacterium]|nr:RHS repeat protein [Myxococcales bacterium]